VKRLEDMPEPELSDLMIRMANAIEALARAEKVEKPLFVLVLFNDPTLGQYIGNCRREDIIRAMREMADRMDRREDIPR
jgi:hypothetical protein